MRLKLALSIVALLLLITAWFFFAWHWSYSEGERAGWVQKLSRKGWICKTWEGEQALVSLPGTATVEKFYFTVHDEATAAAINRAMGKRVNLHYEEKVGLPGSCFGETRHFITGVTLVDENAPASGGVLPVAPGLPASAASR